MVLSGSCPLYTSDAADDSLRVDLDGRRKDNKKREAANKIERDVALHGSCLLISCDDAQRAETRGAYSDWI